MSQSSGLLTEDEIRTYIAESFSFKVDRDALLKPTKDVVMEIYTRFLDMTHYPWRKPHRDLDEYQESNLKCQMVAGIRRMIDRYDTPFTFMITDIISPNRKRTITFLNLLIYVKAQYENLAMQGEEWKSNWAHNREAIDHVNKDISRGRAEIKELKQRLSTAKPFEELNQEYCEKRKLFESLERECDEFSRGAAQIKENIKNSNQQVDIKEAKGRKLDDDITRCEKKLELLDNNRDIKKKILDFEQVLKTKAQLHDNVRDKINAMKTSMSEIDKLVISLQIRNEDIVKKGNTMLAVLSNYEQEKENLDRRLEIAKEEASRVQAEERTLQEQIASLNQERSKKRLHNKIKLGQIHKDLESKRAQTAEQVRVYTSLSEQNQVKIDNAAKEYDELVAKQKALETEYQLVESSVNKRLDEVKRYFLECENLKKKGINNLNKSRDLIETFIGRPKEVTQVVNRTYIKDSQK